MENNSNCILNYEKNSQIQRKNTSQVDNNSNNGFRIAKISKRLKDILKEKARSRALSEKKEKTNCYI